MVMHGDRRDGTAHPYRASGAGRDPGPPGHDVDAGELGQRIANCLFSTGLDVHFALMVAGDGAAGPHLWHAVDQLDEAIRDLRCLVLAILEQDASDITAGRLDRRDLGDP